MLLMLVILNLSAFTWTHFEHYTAPMKHESIDPICESDTAKLISADDTDYDDSGPGGFMTL